MESLEAYGVEWISCVGNFGWFHSHSVFILDVEMNKLLLMELGKNYVPLDSFQDKDFEYGNINTLIFG